MTLTQIAKQAQLVRGRPLDRYQMIEDPLADRPQLLELTTVELVEEVRPYTFHVNGGSGLEGSEPGVGQHCKGATPVRWARLALHPTSVLEAGDRMGEPASRRLGPVGQCAHPQAP